MKKIILISLFVLSTFNFYAQLGGMVFTVTSGVPYNKLSSPTVLTTSGWDDFDAQFPLGFMFHINNDSTNTIYFDSNDFNVGSEMQFSTSSMSTNPITMFNWNFDIEDKSQYFATQTSHVSYKTDVVNNSKITKVQWNNVGFYDDPSHLDSANVQFWFYEDQNIMEYRIGQSSRDNITALAITAGFAGPAFCFNLGIDMNTLSGSTHCVQSLVPAQIDSNDFVDFLVNQVNYGIDSFPQENTLMRWSPAITVGVNAVALNDNFTVYPVLCHDNLNINGKQFQGYKASLVTVEGKLVKQENLNASLHKLSTLGLACGTYYLVLHNDKEKISYKIQKQ